MNKYHTYETGRKNKKVIFLLAGWHNKPWMFWLFSRILSLNGYYCITYTYDGDVFSPDIEKTIFCFEEIRDDILFKISELKKTGYKEFSVFGTSLGSMLALMVANKSQDISKIILNTVGIDVAETVWRWDTVNPKFKKGLLQQNLTLEKLQKSWSLITPANNIINLKNKNLLIYLAKKDEIIPFDLGKRLVQEFKARNYDYQLVTNDTLKHFYAGMYNLVNANRYLSFLKN